MTNLSNRTIYFAKTHPNAKIPTKRREDGGYDIYPLFEESHLTIHPHQTVMIPTGIASAFAPMWRVQLAERGSTGTIGISQMAGLLDSGYRGEWMVPITNLSNKILIIAKKECVDTFHHVNELLNGTLTIYPYEKAICQAKVEYSPNVQIEEMKYRDLKNIESERGLGKLGSSGK